jgi:large subunit ribosomal protein L22
MAKEKQNPSTNGNKTATAKMSYLRISPRKVRLLVNIIRGLPVQEAEAQLMLSPKKSKIPLLKLIRSAVANAENNKEMNPHNLYIKEIKVDEGPTLKRWMPRAFGAIGKINKRTSHINIILEEKEKTPKERFIIPKKSKKEKGPEKKKDKKDKKEPSKEQKTEDRPEVKPEKEIEKPKERKSSFPKIFRRKSI